MRVRLNSLLKAVFRRFACMGLQLSTVALNALKTAFTGDFEAFMCLRMYAHRKSPPGVGGHACAEDVRTHFYAVKRERVPTWARGCMCVRVYA